MQGRRGGGGDSFLLYTPCHLLCHLPLRNVFSRYPIQVGESHIKTLF